MNRPDALFDEIIMLKLQLRELAFRHYDAYEAYGWIWWTGIACMLVLPFVWWKLADKKRLLETCICGLIVIVCAAFLDVAGSDMVLWHYRINILLPVSMLLPIDYVIVPAITMTVYQKCPKWGAYILVSAITAAALSFGLEPFAAWIGEYQTLSWRYFYSFPIYLAINAFSKFLADKLKARQSMAVKASP